MRILVYVELLGGRPRPDSVALLSRAAELGEAAALVCGPGGADHVPELAANGAAEVYLAAEIDAPTARLAQPQVELIADLLPAHSFDAVFFATSILASDIAGGLSSRLEAGLNWELVDCELAGSELVGKRLALDDSQLADVGWTTPVRLATFRPGALAPASGEGAAEASVTDVDVDVRRAGLRGTRIEPAEEGGAEGQEALASADVVVAGGRGLGAAEHLELVHDLADALGAAAAVSMPLVLDGWAPYAMQVGQTGTVVSPSLYVACGISGQIQHRIGMERADTVIAINLDESAPICRAADLVVIADLHEVMPRLAEALRARRAAAATS